MQPFKYLATNKGSVQTERGCPRPAGPSCCLICPFLVLSLSRQFIFLFFMELFIHWPVYRSNKINFQITSCSTPAQLSHHTIHTPIVIVRLACALTVLPHSLLRSHFLEPCRLEGAAGAPRSDCRWHGGKSMAAAVGEEPATTT